MPSTTTFSRGQVIVVNVPYSNHSGVKPRPALVVSAEAFHRDISDLIVCPISSQPRSYRRPGPGTIHFMSGARLASGMPARFGSSKLLAVDKQIVKKILGFLA